MTLIGLHVTQYMYVLFYKKNLILHWRVTFSSSKTVILQRAISIYRNIHNTSVVHVILDPLLLNLLRRAIPYPGA